MIFFEKQILNSAPQEPDAHGCGSGLADVKLSPFNDMIPVSTNIKTEVTTWLPYFL